MSCVRHERATREAFGLVGNERPLEADLEWNVGVSWCGERSSGILFVNADHALLAIEKGTTMLPCPDCLARMAELIRGAMP